MWVTAIVFTAVLCGSANALTCRNDSLKITIADGQYDFNDYENYELRATVAYSLQKYCGGGVEEFEVAASDCKTNATTVDNVHVTNITARIAMCITVDDEVPDTVKRALRLSKANLNGALLLTDQELFVAGIQPTLSPIVDPDFAYWLIAYIVIFGLVLCGGLAMLIYVKCHSKSDDEKAILEEDLEGEPFDDDLSVHVNGGYNEDPKSRVVEEREGQSTML